MKRLIWQFLCIIVIVGGCNTNDLDLANVEGPTLTGKAAIPIGTINYTLRELIERSASDIELEEEDSVLVLYYRDTASFTQGTDIISLDTVSNDYVLTIPVGTPPALADSTYTITDTLVIEYEADNDQDIDSIYYKAGSVELTITTPDFNYPFDYTLSILGTKEQATRDPMVFSGSGSNGSANQTNPLDGYYSTFDFDEDLQTNILNLDFQMAISLSPGDAIPDGAEINILIEYLDQEWSFVYGKMGLDTVNVGNELLDISFFEELGESGFVFGNPILTFEYWNGFGIPLGIDYGGLYGVEGDSVSSDTTFLTGDIVRNPPVINPALSEGVRDSTTHTIDNSNSSIVDFLASSPSQVGFRLKAVTNPNDPEQSNFFTDTSQIVTYIEMKLPLELTLEEVTRDVEFGLGSLDFSEADSLTMRIITVSEIPFEAFLDVEIYDTDDDIADSAYVVINKQVIKSPLLYLDGSLKQTRQQVSDFPIGPVGIRKMNDGDRIVLRVTINTPQSTQGNDIFVDFFGDAKLDIQVSAAGTLTIDL